MKKRILVLSFAFLTGTFVMMSCGAKKTEATEEESQEMPADQMVEESEETYDAQASDSTTVDQAEDEDTQTED